MSCSVMCVPCRLPLRATGRFTDPTLRDALSLRSAKYQTYAEYDRYTIHLDTSIKRTIENSGTCIEKLLDESA